MSKFIVLLLIFGISENRFNDYYLIGNLASVAITIRYVYVYQNFDQLAILRKLAS